MPDVLQSLIRDASHEALARYIVKNLGTSDEMNVAFLTLLLKRHWDQAGISAKKDELIHLAARCRPAVAHYSRMRERDVDNPAYAEHYRPTLKLEAERSGKLLDDLDAIIRGELLPLERIQNRG